MGAKVIVVSEQGHNIQRLLDVPLFKEKPVIISQEWNRLAEGAPS